MVHLRVPRPRLLKQQYRKAAAKHQRNQQVNAVHSKDPEDIYPCVLNYFFHQKEIDLYRRAE